MQEIKVITSDEAPAPIGPYSQAKRAGNQLFVSGQIALDPGTGELVMETIVEETTQVLRNVVAILKAAGGDFSHVVKTSIFLSDMSLFGAVNEVYATYAGSNPPARETVAVKGLPKNVNVEISVIAFLP